MKRQTFEEYLQEKHAEDYHGTDDGMPDAYEKWLEDLQIDGIMALGDKYGRKVFLQGFDEAKEIAQKCFEKIKNIIS